ncbi:MAG: hypothetical protein Q8R77_07740 [Sediminibacterium sp.]|uniref:hypothetical protein n=1 Tax=Sediminibacterium sp. TaxID=1917865 RepID=UPI0027352041|nr:hypothetical protein [Sediminibacterium sp.]MDP3392173.1 hypothetical protein [Sediminibacterium sp.]MDP3567025.1 hypothetical protein [Sediminibacterium sp.]
MRKIYFQHIFLALFIFTAIASLAACETTTTKTIEVSDTELESVDGPEPGEATEGEAGTATGAGAVKTNTGLDIAGLHQADSVQILFFTDPFGKDSLRYTRFFKHYNTSDDSTVQPLLKNLDQLFLLRTEVMKCRSEGKIFFFKGTQELKTVYFSTQANGDCAYMYFIKDGGFYYFPIQPATAALLRKLKPLAVKPSAEN